MRHRLPLSVLPILALAWSAACGDGSDGNGGDGNNPPGPPIGANDGGPDDPNGGKPLAGPSHGSTIGLSEDDARAVVVNTDVGTVSVFSIDWAADALPTVTKTAEVEVGAEPAQTVVHPNGRSAFVIARKDQKLVRVDDLGGAPKKGAEVAVGSEPTSLALEPTGKRVWVSNWVDGTLMAIDTATMQVAATVDLNAALVESGLLGQGITPHPALAHPRAIAITNNGDAIDQDEAVYAVEFYAQQKTPLTADGSNADTAKVGVVYKIPLDTLKPSIIELPPMADMGFKDINGGTAGCFPNQLSSITIHAGFGYVNSVCASPRGPLGLSLGPAAATCTTDATCPGGAAGSCVAGRCATNCTADAQCGANGGKCNANVCEPNGSNVKTTTAPAVSVIDLGGNKTIATVNLAKELDAHYAQIGQADDATRRLPLHPLDIGFVPGKMTAYFPASGTDAIFRVDFDETYQASTITSVGDAKAPFINLTPPGVDPSRVGRVPTGIAVAHQTHTEGSSARFAFVASYATRNLSVVDLERAEVAGVSAARPVVVASTAAARDAAAEVLEGKRLFLTGLGRWSFKGQGWMSCSSCHADGLSDNVSWVIGRGWRQAPTLEAVYSKKDPSYYRINLWTGSLDEPSDHEGAIRSIAGGVGAIVKNAALDYANRLDVAGQTGLNGTSWMVADPANPGGFGAACVIDDWKKLGLYFRTIRSPRRPSNLDPAKVAQGKELFTQASCQGCHGGSSWTISRVFYDPDPTGTTNNALKTLKWTDAATNAGFPAALFPATTPAMQTMRYGGAAANLYDQLTCAMRPVGTFGVAEPEVGVVELRPDGVTVAQGNEPDGRGFNVPSLLGTNMGAPYLHAGQVRTLDALFSDRFKDHHQAFSSTFLDAADPQRADKVRALVEFVLSIDEDTAPIAIPALGPNGGELCAKP